jgi:ribosomal protein S18 acetylase RimI-like enzyme
MRMRTASAADAEAITGVHLASLRAAYGELFPSDELARIDTRERVGRWREHLAGAASIILLAEEDGRLFGFADFGVCRDPDLPPGAVGEVMSVYVRPDAWGRGFGRALMREALARLAAGGLAETVLWVVEANRRAVGFYERLGFVSDGAFRHGEMYGTPTAVVRLRRRAAGETTGGSVQG